MWEIKTEGDREAVYFAGEYQFRCTPEELMALMAAIAKKVSK